MWDISLLLLFFRKYFLFVSLCGISHSVILARDFMFKVECYHSGCIDKLDNTCLYRAG